MMGGGASGPAATVPALGIHIVPNASESRTAGLRAG